MPSVMLVVASSAVVAAATIFAGLMRPRGTVAFLLAVALLVDGIVVATIGGAGLLLRNLSSGALLALALGWVLAAGVLAGLRPDARVAWPTRARGSVLALTTALRDWSVLAAAVLVVGTLAWRAFLAFRLPIVDYDGWSYHLVFADVWLQHGALTLVPQRIWTAGYPADGELLTTWFMAFTRTDALAGLSSLVPIPLAMAAATGLARAFGATAQRALLVGLVLGLTPALVILSGTTYVDGASVAFVASAWWLGLRAVRGERDAGTWLLLGVAGGLAVGTKGTNVLLVAPVLVAAGIVALIDLFGIGRPRRPATAAVSRILLLAAPVVAFGLTWYAKNLLVYGNPLYPFAVGPFRGPTTLTDFAFVPDALAGMSLPAQLVSSWIADWHLTRYAFNVRPGGLGRAWPLILVAAAAGLVLLARRRQLAALVLIALPAAVTLVTMPMPWYARLTLFLPALALPVAAVAVDRLPDRVVTLASLALVAVSAISLAFANIRPNVAVTAGTSTRIASPRQYLAFVLDPNDARRSDIGLRKECAGFDVIPPRARVVPGGFNLLHGVVGPNLDRILTDPVADAPDAPGLARTMRSLDAEWIVTFTGGRPERLAESAPDLFMGYGEICQGGRLWQLRAGS